MHRILLILLQICVLNRTYKAEKNRRYSLNLSVEIYFAVDHI